MIAQFWSIYLSHVNNNSAVEINVTDVAEMMSLLKKVRFIFGDKTNDENFTDDIGYVAIAGMFAGVQPIQEAIKAQERHVVNLSAIETAVRRAAE